MADHRKPAHLFIMTGEASGDLHAAALVRELRDYVPDVRVSAVGGAHLDSVGATLLARIETFTTAGLVEPLIRLPEFFGLLFRLLRELDRDRPDLVMLVDFPEFNMIFAGRLRARGIPIVYYISPQLWAWRPGRAKRLARLVDKMICFFAWEEPFYKAVGLDCEWVGHPLVDTVRPTRSRRQMRKEQGLEPNDPLVAFLPGSRAFEIAQFVPLFCSAAEMLRRSHPDLKFWLPIAPTISEESIRRHIPEGAPPIQLFSGRAYDVMNAADFVVVATGTATLECALLERPMVIVGALGPMTYRIAALFRFLPYYGLVNHLAGRQVVPELLQNDATPERLADVVGCFLDDDDLRAGLVQDIREATANLGAPGAAARAAKAVAEVLVQVGAGEMAA